jgi:Lipocalin-like domain
MKTLFKTLSVIIFISLATSCNKDDDNNSSNASIIGKWAIDRAGFIDNGQFVDVEPFAGNISGCNKDFSEFKADGNYTLGDYTNASCNLSTANGIWTQEGNTIKIGNGQFATYEIVEITETTMILKFKNPSILDEYEDVFYYNKL